MTTPTATEQVRRGRGGRPPTQIVTVEEDWGAYGLARYQAATAVRFPSPRYAADPVAFFREVLGVEPWEKQVEILEALRDHDRVAAKSGRRVSKSHTAAGAALWWYCSWPDARVVMTSTTARQVDAILWRELSMVRARAGRCVACKTEIAAQIASGVPSVVAEQRVPRPCKHSALIGGEIGMLARTGLKSDDFREVWGFTASQGEAVQGIAGSKMLFIVDEASGVPQPIYDAIEGNRAGGAKVLLLGNPTRNEGEFFDAFHAKNKANKAREADEGVGYHCITISSEESPNVKAGAVVVPGLATSEFIRERRIEWGEDSAMYTIHVRGEFAINEAGKIFSVHMIGESEQRWHDITERDREESREIAMRRLGRLFIGLDPAGESGSGDDTVFSFRRGMKHLGLASDRGLDDDGHLARLLAHIAEFALPREVPVVVLDREGSIGASLAGKIRSFLAGYEDNPPFLLVAVRSSERAIRQPLVYDRIRDELAGNLERWIRDGGAIVEDVKLAKELHTLEWYKAVSGRLKLTPKDSIRKLIGRSPDRYDALSLSCWEPLSLHVDDAPESAQPVIEAPRRPVARALDDDDDAGGIDPYAGSAAWRR